MKEEARRRSCGSLKIPKDLDAIHPIEMLREDFLDSDGAWPLPRSSIFAASAE
jgi:hypothetical protein